ncbi:hypothetical protein LWI28_013787 [Acer negundo]|uniref:Uncharacterized protein n=1 Tax=Acer negundo TaxID=4023 RepID=A0AAD5I632_ACENE|nr:hypothetical protein LWI28_013787 [Acer negundo]
MVQSKGWDTYVQHPPNYCPQIVKEFYSSISEVGVGDDEEIVEEDDERLTPWQCVLSAVKLSREDQADAIVEKELGLILYLRKKKAHQVLPASVPPIGNPVISEEEAVVRIAIERSLKESAYKKAKKEDPKGKQKVDGSMYPHFTTKPRFHAFYSLV